VNAVTLPTRARAPLRDTAAFAWRACRSTTRRQWAVVLVIGIVIVLISLPQHVDILGQIAKHPLPVLTGLLLPLPVSGVMFLGWTLANQGSDRWRPRRTRLVYALAGASALAAALIFIVWREFGLAQLWSQLAAMKGKAFEPGWLMVLAEYVNLLIVGGMIYAVAEVIRRRGETQRAFESALRKRTELEHQVLQSRLATMQAQVEPRFLFDTLVDIEALYRRDPQAAALNLDRLISYLRAALPRLREAGSTVDAELALVRAYLDVVTALHGGRPQLDIDMAEDCGPVRFYPMLLLPLVQRAVRHPSGTLSDSIAINVRRDRHDIVIAMRLSAPGGCKDDPELARVRERLDGLYGKAATLECAEIGSEATAMTLRIPANGVAAGR
jgi:hypothetical protein